MKSSSVDYMLESHDIWPLTVAIFYDSADMEDELTKYLCQRLLDIYVIKKEKILTSGNFQGLSKNNSSFEAAIPLILENVLIEFVKSAFIDFQAESLMVPWIYICFNNEFASGGADSSGSGDAGGQGASGSGAASADASATADKSKKQSQSFNSSKVGGGGGGLGTSTNINKSNVGLLANDANHYNSGLNESGLQIEEEFGYATDEDSIFAEFFQKDEEKVISRLGRKVGHNSDIGSVKKQVR